MTFRFRCWAVVVFLGLSARGEVPPLKGASQALHERLVTLVEAFGAEDFDERREALADAHRLIARVNRMNDPLLRRRILATLKTALRHSDLEVRRLALAVRQGFQAEEFLFETPLSDTESVVDIAALEESTRGAKRGFGVLAASKEWDEAAQSLLADRRDLEKARQLLALTVRLTGGKASLATQPQIDFPILPIRIDDALTSYTSNGLGRLFTVRIRTVPNARLGATIDDTFEKARRAASARWGEPARVILIAEALIEPTLTNNVVTSDLLGLLQESRQQQRGLRKSDGVEVWLVSESGRHREKVD